MSDSVDHTERWHDEIAAYALHALDDREAALVARHLEGCGSCAERLRWISPAVDVIPASVAQKAPPPELRRKLMVIVNEEAAPVSASARHARLPRWLPSFEGISLRPVLAGAAALLLLAAGVGGYALRDETSPPGPEVQTYAAVSEAEGSNASGTLRVNGDEGSLRVANLPATEKGQVYQAWIKDSEGSIHPSSVFVLSDDGTGAVSIPAGLSSADRVMVTREPKGGSVSPHESPLLVAQLD